MLDTSNSYIDTKEVAERLSVTERHVRRLVTEGKLKGAIKTGGKWSVPLSEIQQLPKKRTNDAVRIMQLLRPYVDLHMTEIARQMHVTGDQILQLELQPIIDGYSSARLTELRERLLGLERYFREILRNLQEAAKL